MAITLADFNRIWASTSPLTPYSFSEANYKQGWNFIGSTPPARQMWDYLQKNNDEKMQYLANNYLPLSGGQLTGEFLTGRANGTFVIRAGNADNSLTLYGGTTNQNGANLLLYGDNHSASYAQGRFLLRAKKGENLIDLIGTPDGTLTWNGNNVLTDGVVGTHYSAAWTATTSSDNDTVLTNDIANIPIGKYLVIGKLPFTSIATFTIKIQGTGFTNITPGFLGNLGNMATSVALINVTNATNSIRVVAGQSDACNFSYLERGGIYAVRLS